MDKDLEARLRAIVVKNTVIGGYPDTMAIAREAYALDRDPHMTLERTVWHGDNGETETRDIDNWIRTAPHDMMERLLTADLDVNDPYDQELLAKIWNDSGDDMDDLLSGRPLGDRTTTKIYYWGHGERKAFRKAVEHLCPGYLDPHPGQGSLL